MESKFKKAGDQKHTIKLDSAIIAVEWLAGIAYGDQGAPFRVITELVGNGSPIQVACKNSQGKTLHKLKGEIFAPEFKGEIPVPASAGAGDQVYLEVKLPKHSLEAESVAIPTRPPVKVSDLKWSAAEARRGDILDLSGRIKNVPDGSRIRLVIYEHDADGYHDRITELTAVVFGEAFRAQWEYEYHEDTDGIPTKKELERYGKSYNPPEYFFTVRVEGKEHGRPKDSGLLKFRDWVEIEVKVAHTKDQPNPKVRLVFSDGSEREMEVPPDGIIRIDEAPPGPVVLTMSDIAGSQQG